MHNKIHFTLCQIKSWENPLYGIPARPPRRHLTDPSEASMIMGQKVNPSLPGDLSRSFIYAEKYCNCSWESRGRLPKTFCVMPSSFLGWGEEGDWEIRRKQVSPYLKKTTIHNFWIFFSPQSQRGISVYRPTLPPCQCGTSSSTGLSTGSR